MSRTSDPSTILLHGYDTSRDRRDGYANGTITPGEVVKVNDMADVGAGRDARELDVQDASAEPVPFRVAIEYSHTGGGIDDDYESDEHMEYYHIRPGERAYCFLADGEDVSVDDALVCDGNGHFQAAAGDNSEDAAVIAVAAEDLNNDTGDAARLRVEAI